MSRDLLLAIRKAALMIVDAIERELDLSPERRNLEKKQKQLNNRQLTKTPHTFMYVAFCVVWR